MMLDTERKILASGIELGFKEGEHLYRAGQSADYVFYLKDGKIALINDQNKNQPIVLNNAKCFVGLEEFIAEEPHHYSVKILERSEMLVFERSMMLLLMEEYPLAKRYLMLKMCDYLSAKDKVFE